MDNQKLFFITRDFAAMANNLFAEKKGKWGKMNAQQMIEHLAFVFKFSSKKIILPLQTPEEFLPKYKAFLLSDKEFRENTKAPDIIIPEEPLAMRNLSYAEAINELEAEIGDFVFYFKDDPERKTLHPVFGELNFEEWILLHYKHLVHHAKQFELMD